MRVLALAAGAALILPLVAGAQQRHAPARPDSRPAATGRSAAALRLGKVAKPVRPSRNVVAVDARPGEPRQKGAPKSP